MPIYEYVCDDCSTEFELRRRFSDTIEAACPQCEGTTRRVFHPAAVIFKGSGFYVTDSRSESPPSSE